MVSKGHLGESGAQALAPNLAGGGRGKGGKLPGNSGLKVGENEAEASLGFNDQTSPIPPGDGANGLVS